MTREEFLQRLSETPRTWGEDEHCNIRNDCGQDPLQACGVYGVECLDFGTYLKIIRSSDRPDFDKVTRADLLRACGLA